MRYNELDRAGAHAIYYERWVAARLEAGASALWVVKWGKFEERRGTLDKARQVFRTALEILSDNEEQTEIEKARAVVFDAFAKTGTRLKEFERARVIYKVPPRGGQRHWQRYVFLWL
ncbi:hypothetical protein FKP32DRAFT_1586657 [Trametes sanguinea]|nr:hypothetical protein FKP32DRAFT_1586657 [Trametes sanguinea]